MTVVYRKRILTIGELRELLEKFSDSDFVEFYWEGISNPISGYMFDENKQCLFFDVDNE